MSLAKVIDMLPAPGIPARTRDQKLRLRLAMAQGWRCHWCGIQMVYYALGNHEVTPDDFCTLDHLDPRDAPLRRGTFPDQCRKVAACFKCNFERGRREHMARPIEERRRISRQSVRASRWAREMRA